MVLLKRTVKKRPCLSSTNGVKATLVTWTLIGQERLQCINGVTRLDARPGRSQDLYEQSFADGVDFLKGIPPQRGLPCSGPHHCLWLPSSHDSYYLGAETHREFEIQPRKYSKMLQLCGSNLLHMTACGDSRHMQIVLWSRLWVTSFLVAMHCLGLSFWTQCLKGAGPLIPAHTYTMLRCS